MSVGSLTRGRHAPVVVGALALIVGLAACSSDGEGASVAPDAGGNAPDGSFEGSASIPGVTSDPAIPLCALSGPPAQGAGEVLVHADDFDGSAVDARNWSMDDGYFGHATISNSSSPANAVVRDGSLFVVTDRDETSTQYPYRSARIQSANVYARTYGKFEFRARFPLAPGIWYALWAKPWSQPFPEVDIEVVTGPKGGPELYFVNHWAAPPLPANDRRSYTLLKTVDVAQFHTYTVVWSPDRLEMSVDGVTSFRAQQRGIPTIPLYWLINGWVGGWVGEPTAATPFPTTFEVDYFRVYRVDGLIGDPVIKVIDPKTTYRRTDTIEIALANFDEACAHAELYDGDQLVWETSQAPFRFPLSKLRRAGAGPHVFTFAATDGVRKTTATLDVQVK